MTEWISVKDRLPEKYVDVLLFNPSSETIEIGSFFGAMDKWSVAWVDDQFPKYYFSHWMPLPDPPIRCQSPPLSALLDEG